MTLLPIPRDPVYIPKPNTWHRDIYRWTACQKLEDALTLYCAGRYMAVMYLSGYAIECGFKALCCYQSGKPEADKQKHKTHEVVNFLNTYLDKKTKDAITTGGLSDAWENISEYWGQMRMFDLRYNPKNTTQEHAQIFLRSVLDIHEYLAREIDLLSLPPGTASLVPSRYIEEAERVHRLLHSTLD